ncbi:MAG TPA: hypothetical protein VFS43_31815 [Polyangiaceae bacterium]|nr:hypothetical protein [Polyangiaceae bacterium]
MNARSTAALRLVLLAALGGAALAACDGDGDPKKKALSSAGGLSESEWPKGVRGDTPAPTVARSADHALEKGWYKHAGHGDKAPEHNDRASGFP